MDINHPYFLKYIIQIIIQTPKNITDIAPTKSKMEVPLIKLYKPKQLVELTPKNAHSPLQSLKISKVKEKSPRIHISPMQLRSNNVFTSSHSHENKAAYKLGQFSGKTSSASMLRGGISSLKKVRPEQVDLMKNPSECGVVFFPASQSPFKVQNCSTLKMENDLIIEEFTEEEPVALPKMRESIFGDISIESLDQKEEQELEKEKSEFLSNIEAELHKRHICSDKTIAQTSPEETPAPFQQPHEVLRDIKEDQREYQHEFESLLENTATSVNSNNVYIKLENIKKKLAEAKQEITEVEREIANCKLHPLQSNNCLNISLKSVKCSPLARVYGGINLGKKYKDLLRSKMGSSKSDRLLLQAHSPLLLPHPFDSANISTVKSPSRCASKTGSS